MTQMKLFEKILTNEAYVESVAQMTFSDFQAALNEHNVRVKDAEGLFRKLREAIAGGELSDSDLEGIAGGVLACHTEEKEPEGC